MRNKVFTEKETFIQNQKHIFTIENRISNNKLSIDEIDEIIPGYLHLNKTSDLSMTFVSPGGCNKFERTNHELVNNYFDLSEVHVDMDFVLKHSLHAIMNFCQLNDYDNTFSFFEEIRFNPQKNFELFCTDIKMLEGNQELICVTNPIKKLGITTNKLHGILEENKFFDQNFQKFVSLTIREKEILKLIGLGYTNRQIGENLFISNNTIKTHRKNINKKLDAKHLSDLIKYAYTYRLI